MRKEYSVVKLEIKDKKRWCHLLEQSLYPSYLQSMEHEYSKQVNNRTMSTFVFTTGGEDVAGVHYSIKHSKYNLLSTADILSGILFKKKPSEDLIRYILQHFQQFAKRKSVSFIRFTPRLPKNIANQQTEYDNLFNKVLYNLGFSLFEKSKHTYWIDLSKSEEELLKIMKRQTRYRVRQGLRSNIQTKIIDYPDDEMIHLFWEQYKHIGESKRFAMYSEVKFKNEIHTLLKSGLALLFVYKCEGIIVNFSFVSNFGIAAYLHGAINFDFKKLKGCPSPGQLAQWEMMKKVKTLGAKIYDMGFCPGPIPQKEHPAYKIWSFKYDFGGDHVEYLPTYGKVIKPIQGRLFKLLKTRK